jgi:predicted DNA-binding protein
MTEPTKQVAFRLPASLLKRLDAHAERLRREAPWSNATRADAARALLTEALEAQEPRRQKGRRTAKR